MNLTKSGLYSLHSNNDFEFVVQSRTESSVKVDLVAFHNRITGKYGLMLVTDNDVLAIDQLIRMKLYTIISRSEFISIKTSGLRN